MYQNILQLFFYNIEKFRKIPTLFIEKILIFIIILEMTFFKKVLFLIIPVLPVIFDKFEKFPNFLFKIVFYLF